MATSLVNDEAMQFETQPPSSSHNRKRALNSDSESDQTVNDTQSKKTRKNVICPNDDQSSHELENSTENSVFIIEPISRTDKPQTDIMNFLQNDQRLAKDLDASIFGKSSIISVRKNFSRKIAIITTKLVNQETTEAILKLESLGCWKIECRLPIHKSQCFGVIGPISLDTDLEELKTTLISNYDAITDIQRITKIRAKVETPTLCIKISFASGDIPYEKIKVGYQRFPVSVYVSPPWQCYHCQGYGHNAKDCKYKPRCLVCSGDHPFRDCPKKGDQTRVEFKF